MCFLDLYFFSTVACINLRHQIRLANSHLCNHYPTSTQTYAHHLVLFCSSYLVRIAFVMKNRGDMWLETVESGAGCLPITACDTAANSKERASFFCITFLPFFLPKRSFSSALLISLTSTAGLLPKPFVLALVLVGPIFL